MTLSCYCHIFTPETTVSRGICQSHRHNEPERLPGADCSLSWQHSKVRTLRTHLRQRDSAEGRALAQHTIVSEQASNRNIFVKLEFKKASSSDMDVLLCKISSVNVVTFY